MASVSRRASRPGCSRSGRVLVSAVGLAMVPTQPCRGRAAVVRASTRVGGALRHVASSGGACREGAPERWTWRCRVGRSGGAGEHPGRSGDCTYAARPGRGAPCPLVREDRVDQVNEAGTDRSVPRVCLMPGQAGAGHEPGRRRAGVWAGEVRAGVIVALFSVPEGMAYAAIAGFDPAAGLYAGVVPAVVGALLCRSVLMVTTLTSAIALTSQEVLTEAHLDPSDGANVAALALSVGVAMAVFALLRLGSALRLVCGGAMAAFAVGIAVQIVAGALADATGYRAGHHNQLLRIGAWAAHPGGWSSAAAWSAAATVAVWLSAHRGRRTRPHAVLIALVVGSAGVRAWSAPVPLAASLGALPSGLPHLSLPDWGVLAQLAPGAFAVALVALAQAAGISGDQPGHDRSGGEHRAAGTRDVLAQAAANMAGAFFQAMPVGGSLSRTGVAVAAGARTRWTGAASGVALAVLVASCGRAVGLIPLPVIGALLVVVGAKLALARLPELRAAWRRGPHERAATALTFLAATEFPLQYALLLGAAVSLLPRAAAQLHRRWRPQIARS
ncbi:SulP family inorganic anion transporter [Kitasatospora sp. NPDC127059]|uniref:SulP family inorganic anion transporter n=1 Tax=unclassified Kitasatospora TaxID=2633591 RepID=UPI003669259A